MHDAHHIISQVVQTLRVEIPGFEVVGVDHGVCMSGLKLLDLDSWAGICCWDWTTGLAFLSLGAGLAFLGLNSWPWIPVFRISAM